MTAPVRIPADVDLADKILGPLTARQLTILTATGLLLYAAWSATHTLIPTAVFLILAVPLAALAGILALGKRDGISLDRLVLAAIRQQLGPRHRVAAPEGIQPAPPWLTAHATTPNTPPPRNRAGRRGNHPTGSRRNPNTDRISPAPLRLPAEAVSTTGVIDLGNDGLALIAVASTVNFALRTPTEQESLVASFGRYLHSLTAPVQILIRTQRLDLSGQIHELQERAGALPHPALEAAAFEHANYLADLAAQTDLLRRQVLLILREPLTPGRPPTGLGDTAPRVALSSLLPGRARNTARAQSAASAAARRAAETRLVRRLHEAVDLLAAAGITVTPLDAGQATAVLASACNPDSLVPPSALLAGADDVITTTPATTDSSGDTGGADIEGDEFWATARRTNIGGTDRFARPRGRRDTWADDPDDGDAWDDADQDYSGDEDDYSTYDDGSTAA